MQLPEKHQRFLDSALRVLCSDPRVHGVAGGGSLCSGTLDEQSDLDLVIVVRPEAREDIMAQRKDIAARLGPMLSAFAAEHVGEPRMIIAMYGPPLLHVDIKFISLPEFAKRVENPRVLFEREHELSSMIASTQPDPPGPIDLDWIEDRFWTWIHYGIEKTLRMGSKRPCAGSGSSARAALGS
ncbi:MAG: nucleotidyltransferase domain-containing protein [Planctomycetes bacterium]|nr:nucleotidyltransferase domain-containing protein [Planctomycetota bacterium]